MTRTDQGTSRIVQLTVAGIGIAIGVVVALFTNDVILGVIAGSALIAIAILLLRLWTGGGNPRPHHP